MTEDQNPNQAAGGKSTDAKLAAALVGGYVLGRTKKGGAALGLASWLGGNQAGPQAMAMARKGLTRVAQSEQVAQIMAQIRGPLMEAAQKAAMHAALGRVTAISEGLTARMQALGEAGATTVEGTADTIKGTAGTVTDTTKKTVKGTASTVTDTTKKTVKGTAGTTKKTVKGTTGVVTDTTRKAGGRVRGALGRLTGRKKGKAEEPGAEADKPIEEANEGGDEDTAGS